MFLTSSLCDSYKTFHYYQKIKVMLAKEQRNYTKMNVIIQREHPAQLLSAVRISFVTASFNIFQKRNVSRRKKIARYETSQNIQNCHYIVASKSQHYRFKFTLWMKDINLASRYNVYRCIYKYEYEMPEHITGIVTEKYATKTILTVWSIVGLEE